MQGFNFRFNQQQIKFSLVLLITLVQLSGCAYLPWERKRLEQTPEERIAAAEQQMSAHPDKAQYRKSLYINKEKALSELLELGNQAHAKGDVARAQSYYDRVLELEPHNQQALFKKQMLSRELALIKKVEVADEHIKNNQLTLAKELVHDVLLERPELPQANALDAKLKETATQSKVKPPQLKPSSDKPITLELRDANIKVVFEALSRATGINFVLDKDIKPETKATVFVKKMPIAEAIDMVLASNGLEKKVLTENSALVFPNTPQKLKDYQDLIIRSFYLSNTNAKQVSALLKTMLKTKDIFIDERLNMIVMRDTPEIIRIAEKLVIANDMADPEVMLDIEVLEVSRSRLQELGIVYPNQLAVIGADTGLTLEALKNINSSRIGVSPNPAVNFKKTTGDVNVLSNPRIRVKNNEKAKILVGDKVPIITSIFTANVGTSESVSYVDVGLKLNVEPRINLDNFVNIKVDLEVSSLGERTVTRNGSVIYTIGTRNTNTALRLKHGETQILAGLILDDERKNAAKLPGLGDVPLLGRLFANQEDRKSKTEIVLAITPRILTNIQLPSAEISEYWSGTESVISDQPRITIPAASPTRPKTTIEYLRQQRAEEEAARQQNPEASAPVVDQVAPVQPPPIVQPPLEQTQTQETQQAPQ